ncbi:MAG: SDR family NAD(P)-dependent oxidoreductase [Haloarculaceae archaeon]
MSDHLRVLRGAHEKPQEPTRALRRSSSTLPRSDRTTALLDRGYRIAALDIDVAALRSLREERPADLSVHECDVSVDEAVETAVGAAIARWNGVDILVNNAAIFNFAPFEDVSLAAARREFEVNYFGYVRTIRAVLPHMRANGGIIHNVSSGVGLVGHPGLSGYAATKGAIEALTRSLRLELRDQPVSCTVMHPPLTATPSAERLDYPALVLRDPADVGRMLAERIESTDAVVTDWQTRLGLAVARRVPWLVRRGTRPFVAPGGTTADS